MKDRKSFYNINQAAHCRNSLCDHCGISASFYTHSKDYNKNYIQNNIDHSRNDQEIQWRLGVTQRTQESRKCIICTCDNKTCINNSHICSYITKYLFRRIHQMQNWFVRKTESYCHNNGKCSHKVNGHGNIMAHPVKFFRSEHLGYNNRKPTAKPIQPACYKEHQRTGASNCRKCIYADKFSGNDRVRNVIKLLEKISQTHGNHKFYDQTHRIADCHIICCISFHSFASSLSCSNFRVAFSCFFFSRSLLKKSDSIVEHSSSKTPCVIFT